MENPTIQNSSLYMQNLTCLPIEVLKNIFSHFSQKSRQKLRIVCGSWKYMIDETLMLEVNNEYNKRTIKLIDTTFVRVRNFTPAFEEIVMFTHKIRILEFWDVVVSYDLVHFLGECNFVQELNFANVTLDSHRRMKCPEGLCLPKVKVMTVTMKWNFELTVDELVLFDFLSQVKFGQLDEVKIRPSHPYPVHRDVEMGLLITDPLPKTELPYGIKSTAFLSFLIQNRESVKKLVVDDDALRPFGSQIEEMTNELHQLQFEEIKCHIRKAGKVNGNEFLVIEGQRALKKFDINVSYDSWPALVRAIAGSASSLLEVTISIFSWTEFDEVDRDALDEFRNHGLDASIFKDCSELESIWLDIRDGRAPLFNLTSLPDSIRKLFIMGTLSQDDLLAIASKLSNLKDVDFSVENPILNVNVEIVQAYIRIKTFAHLGVVRCTADEDGISEFLKSHDEFEIDFHFFGYEIPARQLYLTISKKLTTQEPSI